MAGKINIFADEWVDMVFKSKNQVYGAFVLRKESPKRHLFALITASILFVLSISSPMLLESIGSKMGKEADEKVTEFADIKLDAPKPLNQPIDLPPPPPVLRNSIKFTPPVIKNDNEVNEEEELKTNKEVMEDKSVVSNVTYDKGTDDIEAPPATEDNKITEVEPEPFVIVEQMPEFPGGLSELNAFISKNIRFPALAAENGISGKVYLTFVIDKYGKVSKIRVLRGIGGGCDEEAIRVVKMMPTWKPGRQGGVEVPVSYNLPINFKIQQ